MSKSPQIFCRRYILEIKSFRKIDIFSDKSILNVFSLYFLILIISNTTLEYQTAYIALSKGIRYACYLYFFIASLINIKKEAKMSLVFIGFSALCIAAFAVTRDMSLIFIVLIMYGIKNIDFDELVKRAFYILLIAFCVIVILSIIDVLPNWTFKRDKTKLRYALGFHYATIPATYYIHIVLMRIYLKRGNIPFSEMLLGVLIGALIYLPTDSRTGFYIVVLAIVLTAFLKLIRNTKIIDIIKKPKILYILLPVLSFAAISAILIMFDNGSQIADNVNRLLSKRLYFSLNAFKEHGVPLLGVNAEWFGWGGYGYIEMENFKYNYVDISYFMLIFDYGILIVSCIIAGFTKSFADCFKKKNHWAVFCLVFVLINCLIEPNLMRMDKNIFMLLLIPVLFNTRFSVPLKFLKRENK